MTKITSAVILYTLSQALLVVGLQQAVCPISTVTSCFEYVPPTPVVGGDGCVTVTMPPCQGCGCATCFHTHVYTTTLDVFGGVFGVRPSAYTVKEIYQGMSRAPIYPRQTGIPMGFTVANDVCTTCGFFAITRTMTYPIGGHAVAFTPRPTKRSEIDMGEMVDIAPVSPAITAAPLEFLAERSEGQQQEQQGKVQEINKPATGAAARGNDLSGSWTVVKMLMPLGLLFW